MLTIKTDYILYFKQELNLGEFKGLGEAVIEINKSGDCAGLSESNFNSLGKGFARGGWRINSLDQLRTITPGILNEWAEKPWSEHSGIEELIERGSMFLYRGATPDEMKDFYSSYLKEI